MQFRVWEGEEGGDEEEKGKEGGEGVERERFVIPLFNVFID